MHVSKFSNKLSRHALSLIVFQVIYYIYKTCSIFNHAHILRQETAEDGMARLQTILQNLNAKVNQ